MNTSLTFEVLLYLNSYYFGFFAICEVGMNIMKQINMNAYGMPLNEINVSVINSTIPVAAESSHGYSTDFGILVTVCILELVRVIIARKGNLLEQSWPVIVSILLTIPSAFGIIYLMIWQSWVLRFEYIICCIQLAMQGSEIIFGILSLLPICKTTSYYY